MILRFLPAVLLLLLATSLLPVGTAWAAPPAPAVDTRVGHAPAPVPAGLRLLVRHRADEGRLVVRVGGMAVLSAPFSVMEEDADGLFERSLSVVSGPQTVTVLVIDGEGRLVAQKMIGATLEADAISTLRVEERGRKGLTLEWKAP